MWQKDVINDAGQESIKHKYLTIFNLSRIGIKRDLLFCLFVHNFNIFKAKYFGQNQLKIQRGRDALKGCQQNFNTDVRKLNVFV